MQRALHPGRILVRMLEAFHSGVEMCKLFAATALALRQRGKFSDESSPSKHRL